ncbi:unnamed protein product [Thlaspi arvense]|uniref:Bifunctional inhibitor/plant lipid transfer protein/seed storage helical domain-containing protein n=1 Tax=Thlaspi arvense TaxID=13288 RepID=A0AAU9T2P0_THLAR|nr:unnamed protein product [Thlaspi arvense]
MASKNMTMIMALYLTFNLVFLGFASAQPPVTQQDCPIDLLRLEVCADRIASIRFDLIPSQVVAQCCTLLAQLSGVCAREVVRISLKVELLSGRANGLFGLCPGVAVPPGGVSCN